MRDDHALLVHPLELDVPELVGRAHGEEVVAEAEVRVGHRRGARRPLRRVEGAVEPALEGRVRDVRLERERRGPAGRLLLGVAGPAQDRRERRRRDDPRVGAGVASTLPAASIARTRNVCEPRVRSENSSGDVQRVPHGLGVERALEGEVGRERPVVGAGEVKVAIVLSVPFCGPGGSAGVRPRRRRGRARPSTRRRRLHLDDHLRVRRPDLRARACRSRRPTPRTSAAASRLLPHGTKSAPSSEHSKVEPGWSDWKVNTLLSVEENAALEARPGRCGRAGRSGWS